MGKLKEMFGRGYKAFMTCPNCGFNSEIKIPKGVSVADFVKGGKCRCDNCNVVFYPAEYTTEYFEREKNKFMEIVNKKFVKEPGAKPKHKPLPISNEEFW